MDPVTIAWNVACSLAAAQIFGWIRQEREPQYSRDEAEQEWFREEFVYARKLLKENRKRLAVLASDFTKYRNAKLIDPSIPLLSKPGWIPDAPIRLTPPDENLSDDSENFHTVLDESRFVDVSEEKRFITQSCKIMPPNSEGVNYSDYVEAIESIPGERPGKWESRPSYRLQDVKGDTLTFLESEYFQYQRTCEVLCYEMALQLWRMRNDVLTRGGIEELKNIWRELELRQLAGEWDNLNHRHSVAGINNLTILYDSHSKTGTFIMMQRGKGRSVDIAPEEGEVASAMGAIHVAPAGEFQPSSKELSCFRRECSIWYTLLREFAEEIWLMPEAETQSHNALDYDTESPLSRLLNLAREHPGKFKAYYLGVAIDPLSFKTEILTTTIIEKFAFLNIAHKRNWRLPNTNSEGIFFAANKNGIKLTQENLNRYIKADKTLPAAMGCLELASRHLPELLS